MVPVWFDTERNSDERMRQELGSERTVRHDIVAFDYEGAHQLINI